MKKIEIEKIDEKGDYQASEAYKRLRTNLQLCGADRKVIVVSSCMPNEGKTTTTMNLAISLAEVGKKVIFIDADLLIRRPSFPTIAEVFTCILIPMEIISSMAS